MSHRRSLLFKTSVEAEQIPYDFWYRLEETSGTDVFDVSGNYDATAVGNYTQGQTGQVDDCYLFTSAGSGSVITGSTLGYTALPISFGWWQYVTSFQTAHVIATDVSQTYIFEGLSIFNLSSGNLSVRLANGTNSNSNAKTWTYNSALSLNTWQSFVVVVNSMSDVDLYIDGVLTAEDSIGGSGTAVSFNQNYRLMRQTVSTSLGGYLDEVKGYNGAWTQSQVELMYDRESVGDSFTALP